MSIAAHDLNATEHAALASALMAIDEADLVEALILTGDADARRALMLHMGYVDEVLFGREVVEEMPRITAELVQMVRDKGGVKAELD